MHSILRLKNAVQPYAWGSRTALSEFLGQTSPSMEPQAEMWMGAHPKASSQVYFQGQWQDLSVLVAQDPLHFLGPITAHRFGGTFPFLFKVLAVAQPLSIQAHPNKIQAQHGFKDENDKGIPLDSPLRNYRDNRHKPECLCALSPFWAMCGFRQPDDIASLLDPLWPRQRRFELTVLKENPDRENLKSFFKRLLEQPSKDQRELVAHIVHQATSKTHGNPLYRWITRLNDAYPGDVGCITPGILNLIHLKPGQAIFLPAGQLHAYLKGFAIEIMANSDNVLRGGLTPKHIDVIQLLEVLHFDWPPLKVLTAVPISHLEGQYPVDVSEFALSVITLTAGRTYKASRPIPQPEILLCIKGEVVLHSKDDAGPLILTKGQSVLVAAAASTYELTAKEGVLYKASVTVNGEQRRT